MSGNTECVTDCSTDCTSESHDEIHLHNILNTSNMLITPDDVLNIFSILNVDIKVENINYYQRAFVHKSYIRRQGCTTPIDTDIVPLQPQSNERDEFYGDGFIGCIVGKYLYNRYDDQEGFLTRLRTKLVNGKTLCKLSNKLGLSKFVLMSKHVEENCKGRQLTSVLENVLEAFISALYQDQMEYAEKNLCGKKYDIIEYLSQFVNSNISNNCDFRGILNEISMIPDICPSGWAFSQTEKFIVALFEKFEDFSELVLVENNFKDILLKYFQKKYKDGPIYKEISIEGPSHERIFTISVHHLDDALLGIGTGRTKRDAQQMAAKEALITMGLEAKYI